MTPAQVLRELNRLGGKHGIGCIDIVESRYVGMVVIHRLFGHPMFQRIFSLKN